MTSKRSPAFQFYANDWLSSPKIMLMTPAQEGAYIRLLCIAWNDPDCSLPDSDDELSTLSRLGEGWFNGGSTRIRSCFEPHPTKPGRLVNPRLIEERVKQEEWREKSKAGGIKSGQARRAQSKESTSGDQDGPNGGSRVVKGWFNQTPTLQSSSSSSNKGEDNPPLCFAIEEIYPGHASNPRVVQDLVRLAMKLEATNEDVLNFPVWLKAAHPKKANSPHAFKDLFAESLKASRTETGSSKPQYKCQICRDIGFYFDYESKRNAECFSCPASGGINARTA